MSEHLSGWLFWVLAGVGAVAVAVAYAMTRTAPSPPDERRLAAAREAIVQEERVAIASAEADLLEADRELAEIAALVDTDPDAATLALAAAANR